MIAATTRWLAENPRDTEVLKKYLGLVEQRGTPEQLELTRILTENWFKHNHKTRDTFILEGYGQILFKLERYQEAEAQFRYLLTLKRSYVPARFSLAWSLYFQGKKKEAYKEFQHAKWWTDVGNLYPIGGALNHLGRYYLLEGDLKQAIQHFQEATIKAPDIYGNYRELGGALLAQNQNKLALKAFQEAQNRLPLHADVKIRVELEELIKLSLSRIQEN